MIRRGESGGVAGVADLEDDHCPANQGLVVGQVSIQPPNVGQTGSGPGTSLLTDVVEGEQPLIVRSLFEWRVLIGNGGLSTRVRVFHRWTPRHRTSLLLDGGSSIRGRAITEDAIHYAATADYEHVRTTKGDVLSRLPRLHKEP